MEIIGIIPARLASTRFPGKPLAKICGIPMIGHVYFRSKMSKRLKEVYVAGCDREIEKYIESIGGKYIATRNTHERASDRTAEAILKIEKQIAKSVDIVAMIQGDEPMLHPDMIDQSIVPLLQNEEIKITNLVSHLKSRDEQNDANEVKVVVDLNGFALYFSREPIPSWKKGAQNVEMLKQVCIIPFRRDFLMEFNKIAPGPLEKIESVDMLRVLEHGYKVKMVLTNFDTYSVDTLDDLRKVEGLMKKDFLIQKYKDNLIDGET